MKYMRELEINNILIRVWLDKHYSKYPITIDGAVIVINDRSIKKDQILKYVRRNPRKIDRVQLRIDKGLCYSFNYRELLDYSVKCTQIYADALGIEPPKVKLTDSKKNYGYCHSSKQISVSTYKHVTKPVYELHDTIAHEVLHCVRGYGKHTKKFYDKLEQLQLEVGSIPIQGKMFG